MITEFCGGETMFAFGLTCIPHLHGSFFNSWFDLFLDSGITVSWLKDNEVKEATDWMSNTKPQLMYCDPEKWEMIVQVSLLQTGGSDPPQLSWLQWSLQTPLVSEFCWVNESHYQNMKQKISTDSGYGSFSQGYSLDEPPPPHPCVCCHILNVAAVLQLHTCYQYIINTFRKQRVVVVVGGGGVLIILCLNLTLHVTGTVWDQVHSLFPDDPLQQPGSRPNQTCLSLHWCKNQQKWCQVHVKLRNGWDRHGRQWWRCVELFLYLHMDYISNIELYPGKEVAGLSMSQLVTCSQGLHNFPRFVKDGKPNKWINNSYFNS